jgi:hypothetical protein
LVATLWLCIQSENGVDTLVTRIWLFLDRYWAFLMVGWILVVAKYIYIFGGFFGQIILYFPFIIFLQCSRDEGLTDAKKSNIVWNTPKNSITWTLHVQVRRTIVFVCFRFVSLELVVPHPPWVPPLVTYIVNPITRFTSQYLHN